MTRQASTTTTTTPIFSSKPSSRHLAEERALGHESALNVVAHRALQTEQRSQGAERLLRRLRGAAAEAEAMAMSMQRASAAEEERTKKVLKDRGFFFGCGTGGWVRRDGKKECRVFCFFGWGFRPFS